MASLPIVKIKQNSKGLTDMFVDGHLLKSCYHVEYEQNVGEIPTFTFSTYSFPEIECKSAAVEIMVNPTSMPMMLEAIDYCLDIEGISPDDSWSTIKERLNVAFNAR